MTNRWSNWQSWEVKINEGRAIIVGVGYVGFIYVARVAGWNLWRIIHMPPQTLGAGKVWWLVSFELKNNGLLQYRGWSEGRSYIEPSVKLALDVEIRSVRNNNSKEAQGSPAYIFSLAINLDDSFLQK